jgi:hypothetical protein
MRAGLHYAWWFPTRFIGWGHWPRYAEFGPLATHLRFIDRTARKLARSTFYAMLRFGPKLEKRQAVLGRIVDVGAELFVMTAACVRAQAMRTADPSDRTPVMLADLFCKQARRRIGDSFRRLFANDDTATFAVAEEAMAGRFNWLETAAVVSMQEAFAPSSDDVVAVPTEDRQPEPAGAD